MSEDRCFNAAEQESPTMADALKPCPFCGNRAILRTGSNAAGRLEWAVVSCDFTQPGHCDSIDAHDTEAAAIAAWNRRSLAPPTEAEVGAAAKVLYNARQEGLTSEGRIPWGNAHKVVRDEFVDDARAALVAFVAGRNGG